MLWTGHEGAPLGGGTLSPPDSPAEDSSAPPAKDPNKEDMRPPEPGKPLPSPVPVDTVPTSGPSQPGPSPQSTTAFRGFDAPVYAPTRVKAWEFCPVRADLERQGWHPLAVEWDPAKTLGKAIGEALGAAYRLRKAPQAPQEAPGATLSRVLASGYHPNEKWTLEGLEKIAQRGLKVALEDDVIGPATVLMVDEPLPSGSRPDLVLRHPSEGLIVHDDKVTFSLKDEWRARRFAEYDTDWQFWHYAWEVEQLLGEPVSWVRVRNLTLTPKARSEVVPVRITPTRLAFWLLEAEYRWMEMRWQETGEIPIIPRWSSCHGKYGRCIFYDYCHVFGGDPMRASAYYTQAEPSTGEDGL